MTATRATTAAPLPAGWTIPRVRRNWAGIATGTGVYDLNDAADHVRAEAATFPTSTTYDPEILRRRGLSKRRVRRWLTREVTNLETGIPRSEWLDPRFAFGPPDVVLRAFDPGARVALKYHSGRPDDAPVELAGYLRVAGWTSFAATMVAYSLDHDLPGQEHGPANTHLSEFGCVWDARVL